MDVSLVRDTTNIVLNGSGALAPLRAGRVDISAPGVVTAELALDGTAAAIGTYLQNVERLLYLAEWEAGRPGEYWGYVKVTLPDASVWLAPIKSGRVESVVPGSRGGGSMGLRVRVNVEPYWVSDTFTSLPLSNRNGSNYVNGILVNNHYDSGHDNWANILGGISGVIGDVPAPAILSFTSTTADLDCIFAQAVDVSAGFNAMLEGEALTGGTGLTVTSTADSSCSGGYYGALAWSGAGAVSGYWSVDGTNAAYYKGRIYRPVFRLRNLVAAGEKIWAYCWSGYNGSTVQVLDKQDGLLLPTDQRLVVFPPMALPAWSRPPTGFSWEGFVLGVTLQAEGTGAHAVGLDFVEALPCDGWQRFIPLVSGLANTQIRYDGGTGVISRSTSAIGAHAPEGAGLWLYPGLAQRIYVAMQAAPLANVDWGGTVKIQYQARKRSL